MAILVLVAAARFPNTPVSGFTFDTGIQMNLSRLTAEGAVPLIDFEHGWNAGAWYVGAGLWHLVGRSPDLWWYAFTVGGQLVAGLAVIFTLHRRGVGQLWMVALTVGWLAASTVAHLKYAIPAIVVAVLTWSWGRGTRTRLALTTGMFAVLVVTHVELAVMLGAGLSLFELVGVDGQGRERLWPVLSAPAGIWLGLALELLAYDAIGLGPGEVIRQLIADQTVVDPAAHFGYPLFGGGDFRTHVLPALLLIPFLPSIWGSLDRVTRLVACMQVPLVLIALRRTDSSHVAAATTLLPVLVGLMLLDLRPRLAEVRSSGLGRIDLRWGMAGAVVLGVSTLVGFTAASLLAVLALLAGALSGAGSARLAGRLTDVLDRPAGASRRTRASGTLSATVGGICVAGALLTVNVGGGVVAAGAALPGDTTTDQVAEAVRQPLMDCTGGDPAVWVVPHPLGLYPALDIHNPTPFVMFHYPFAREHDRVMDMVDAGQIPTIVAYGPWQSSFRGLDVQLEHAYEECARITPPATPQTVRILRYRGP